MFGFIGTLFNTFLFIPIFNFLIWLYGLVGSFGFAIIILTVLIRLMLYPLNDKSLKAQKEVQEIQPLVKEIQVKYKEDSQKQAEELLKLYKEKKFNPFSGFLYIFLQIPIIIALFQVIKRIADPETNLIEYVYPFINFSGTIDPIFFQMNLSEPNSPFAFIVAMTQLLQVKLMQPKEVSEKNEAEKMQSMIQKQMMFILPIFTFIILSKLPSAIGIYWMIITIVTIIQQKIILKK
ncbi:MAG: YidC/Oxa1 family membrane protein insertase [Candidatus Paceibacterota bacterium]